MYRKKEHSKIENKCISKEVIRNKPKRCSTKQKKKKTQSQPDSATPQHQHKKRIDGVEKNLSWKWTPRVRICRISHWRCFEFTLTKAASKATPTGTKQEKSKKKQGENARTLKRVSLWSFAAQIYIQRLWLTGKWKQCFYLFPSMITRDGSF